MAEAGQDMVIYHPNCLHVRVDDSWAEEFEATLFQIFSKSF